MTLPYEDFYITSPLSPDDVSSRLAEYVTPVFTGSFKDIITNRYSGYYKGFVNSSGFKIVPVVVGRASFIPEIKGGIEQAGSGSRIRLTFSLYQPALILAWIFFSFLTIMAIAILIKGAGSNRLEPMIFAPLGMMVIIYIVMMLCFVPETISSKKFLLEVFEAEYD